MKIKINFGAFGIFAMLFFGLTNLVWGKSLPNFTHKTLKNGLEVIIVPTNKNGVIQTNVIYKVGSRNEIMGKSGIAHMLEHMNFKSTQQLKDGDFDKIVRENGGVTNASTGFDYTHYYIKSAKNSLDKNLGLFAEVMANLNLKDSEFQSERNVVAEERRWRTDNRPVGYLFWRFFNTAFVYHPYHWTPIGFVQDILSWDLQDIKDFHKTYYQPQNAVVLIVGDVDTDDALKLTQKHFEGIKNSSKIPPVAAKIIPQDGQRSAIVHKDTKLEYIAIGFKTAAFDTKDSIALEALSSYLSDGKSSVFYKQLIDGKRIANDINGINFGLKDGGVQMFIASVANGVKSDVLKDEILKIIDEIKAGQIPKQDLDKLKINLKKDFIGSIENVSSISGLFAQYAGRGNLDALLNYESDYEALSIKDLVEVANKYFIDTNKTTLFLKP
ncbi:MAG: pitrilysin family protein [Helicobacter sp.]|nr:pitrilysin family protein [Helicobacter sp.]